MSDDPDTEESGCAGVPRAVSVLEVVRASYAVGIGGAVTALLVFGVVVLGRERLGPVAPAVDLIPLLALLLPVVLYVYDRRHEHDLVVAELGHLVVRPFAVVYRVLRVGGP